MNLQSVRSKLLLASVLTLGCTVASAATIYMDFGETATTGELEVWNNLNFDADVEREATLSNDLLDINGNSTGISAVITDAFHGTSANGGSDGNITGTNFPDNAAIDYFWGHNSTTDFGGVPEFTDNGRGSITFSGLTPGTSYDFTIFASRTGGTDRTTLYELVGAETSAQLGFNPVNNADTFVNISGVAASAGGEITLSAIEDNNEALGGIYYLGLVQMTEVPEPSTYAMLCGVLALATSLWARRRRR